MRTTTIDEYNNLLSKKRKCIEAEKNFYSDSKKYKWEYKKALLDVKIAEEQLTKAKIEMAETFIKVISEQRGDIPQQFYIYFGERKENYFDNSPLQYGDIFYGFDNSFKRLTSAQPKYRQFINNIKHFIFRKRVYGEILLTSPEAKFIKPI